MDEYIQHIIDLINPSFKQIREIATKCISHLSQQEKDKLWLALNRGVNLLDTHELMCQYLFSFGNMHQAKINKSLENIDKTIFNQDLTIIDWGCGQGLATVCFFDFLNQNNIKNKTKKVILIEPSKMALEWAKLHVNAYLKDEAKISSVNKYLDDVTKEDTETDNNLTIHFFSNILDIPSVDLEKLTKIIQNDLFGTHYFFCVGPMNSGSTRIDIFAQLFGLKVEQIIEKFQGQLKKRGTIKLLVFKIKGKEIEVIKTDYYPPIPNNMNYIKMLEKILRKVNPSSMNDLDKIIQFYRTVVELERLKEPEIKEVYSYPVKLTNDTISLDLTKNTQFLSIYDENKNPKTKWPQDLYIGIYATLKEISHPIFHYIIPFEDIKSLDVKTQLIPCKTFNFSINLKTFQNLELSNEQIEEIENIIKEQKSFEKIGSILKEKIDKDFILNDYFCLALSSKSADLSRIHSELKNIKSDNSKGNLLEDFLLNKKIDNKQDNLKEEDLIQISGDIDDRQKESVLNAFNSKLTVITGPPGSGKTQVILNILANAVLHNKKVLVASKNNKAVDNVKDRFDEINKLGYFLRFGTKKIIEENTKPAIERIVNLIPTIGENTNFYKSQFEENKEKIKENRAKLFKRNCLIFEFSKIEQELLKIEGEILVASKNDIDFFRTLFDIHKLDSFSSFLKTQRNNIELKYSGIKKLWFDWFNKKKYAKEILDVIELYPFEIRDYFYTLNLKSKLSDFKNGNVIIELYSQLIDVFSKAIVHIKNYSKLEVNMSNFQKAIANKKEIIDEITANEPTILAEINASKQAIKDIGKPLLLELIKNKLINCQVQNINNFKNYLPVENIWRDDEVLTFTNTAKNFLDIFNITAVTSLSAKAAFPRANEIFDMVVIDEASQCDIASAIPLILRAKQLVVIGDPMQLKHISMVNSYEETYIKEHLLVTKFPFLSYNKKSLYDYCKDLLALNEEPDNIPLMIDKHYRCHPQIIGYSNEVFYTGVLGNQLTICTTENQFPIQPKGIIWVDVKGEQTANNINVNEAEVCKSIAIATQLATTYPDISIGIVTPFKNQAEKLNSKIPDIYRDRIIADTVHKFQGDEKDVMIYSLVVTDNSPSTKIKWIDESVPNLVNVAVTRARNTLYIVGNKEYIRQKSPLVKPLGRLVEYVERKNK